eukprot:1161687-Pelagomonas_calceolata.AAC.6
MEVVFCDLDSSVLHGTDRQSAVGDTFLEYALGHTRAHARVHTHTHTHTNTHILTRMDTPAQVVHSPYRGVLHCVTQVYKQEGLRAFFKSYRTTLVMNIPFITMHFT